MLDSGHHLSASSGIAAQFVGDDLSRHVPQPFQQLPEETLGSLCVAFSLHQNIQHIPILVNGPPKTVKCAFYRNKDLIKMPSITVPPLSAPDTAGKLVSEFQAPQANRLVGDLDSSRREHLLDVTETQAEAVVEPDGMGNDLDRESVPRIRRFLFSHQQSLPASKPSSYTGFNKLTVPFPSHERYWPGTRKVNEIKTDEVFGRDSEVDSWLAYCVVISLKTCSIFVSSQN